MADNKEINIPQPASLGNRPAYKDHVNSVSLEAVLGELVCQMADAML